MPAAASVGNDTVANDTVADDRRDAMTTSDAGVPRRMPHLVLPIPSAQVQDLVLAALCLAVALAIQLTGAEAVPGNRKVGVVSVGLTVLTVAPLALRRRFPLPV